VLGLRPRRRERPPPDPTRLHAPGPDLPWNIISLCGSGTSECHGAFHGNPYTTAAGERITPTIVKRQDRRAPHPRPARLHEVWDFLDGSELRYSSSSACSACHNATSTKCEGDATCDTINRETSARRSAPAHAATRGSASAASHRGHRTR
jgi:hypothetical protein